MVLKDFQEKKEFERALSSWPVLIFVGLLLALAFYGVARGLSGNMVINREIKELEKDLADAEGKRKVFEAKLNEVGTPEWLEKEARGKFNLKKPGEEIVIFLEEGKPPEISYKQKIASIWEFVKNILLFR